MGGVKRKMEEDEGKRSVAQQIAIEAGVLAQCECHDDCIYEGSNEIEDAYKLGNRKFSNGDLEGTFKNRQEMTDLIKEVVGCTLADECFACAKKE